MKKCGLLVSVSLALWTTPFAFCAKEEPLRSVFDVVDDFSTESLFDEASDFEEPATIDIEIGRERKPEISIKDLPFYTKLFCSYVYEEKLQRWYYAFFGYISQWKHKKMNFGKQRWGK